MIYISVLKTTAMFDLSLLFACHLYGILQYPTVQSVMRLTHSLCVRLLLGLVGLFSFSFLFLFCFVLFLAIVHRPKVALFA